MAKGAIEELFESWITDLISGVLGAALISVSIVIKPTNNFWWIAFVSGIIFEIPLFYFKLWETIKEWFGIK